MNELPNPLTPADCDLRDFPFMPLDVVRLCDSDLAALESPEACWAALLLWCKAWHQVPAGSLPDDDRVLAKFTGYQRAPEAWLAIRSGALRGWIKCADGRLYHPVVAEKANEGWFAKHRQAHDKLCERIRKRNKGRPENGQIPLEVPELEQWIDMGRPLERELFPSEFRTASGGNTKTSAGKEKDFRRKGSGLPEEESGSGAEFPGSEPGNGAHEVPGVDESGPNARDFGSSGANPKSSGGTPENFRRNDGEIPPENALKGKEGKGQGEVKDKTSGSVIASGASARTARDDSPVPQTHADWCRYFAAEHGIELNASNVHHRNKAWPLFTAWIKAGVSIGQMDRACAKARAEAKGAIAFLPAYADTVLASMDRPAAPHREDAAERRARISKANGDAWLAESPESDPNVIDMEH